MKSQMRNFSWWWAGWLGLLFLGLLDGVELSIEQSKFGGWQDGSWIFHYALLLLILLSASLALLGAQQKTMGWSGESWIIKVLYWTPRVTAILFTLLIGALSFDVFSENGDPLQMALAFLIHSIPALVLMAGLSFAWRHEWVGALVFMGWAVWYAAFSFTRGFPLSVYVEVALLPFLLGVLFLLNWLYRRDGSPQ